MKTKTIQIIIITILSLLLAFGLLRNMCLLHVADPGKYYGMILEDNSLLFLTDDTEMVVITDTCNPAEVFYECANVGKHFDAVVMQADNSSTQEAVLSLIRSFAVDVLLIPDNTDAAFLEHIAELALDTRIEKLSDKKYFSMDNVLLQVLNNYEHSASLSFACGEQTFLVSSEVCSQKEHFTYALMPSNALSVSNITCDYAVFDQTVVEDALYASVKQLTDFSAGAIYFMGENDTFGVLGVRH